MKEHRLQWFPPVLLVMVSVVWGTTFFVVKDTVQHLSPFLLVAVRSLLASVPLFVVVAVNRQKVRFSRAALFDGMILGGLMGAMYTSQTIGLQFTSSGHSAFITGIAVVLVPVVMFVFFGYRFSFQNVGAILLVAVGLFFLTYDIDTQINLGDLITLITALTAAFHIALVGRAVRKHHVGLLVAYQFLFSGLFNLGAHLVWQPHDWHIAAEAWPALIYLAFIGTLFCYGASSWAQQYVNPVGAALIFSLEPVFAAIFSYWFAAEVLSWGEIGGAALIMLGILYYELPVRKLRDWLTARFQA